MFAKSRPKTCYFGRSTPSNMYDLIEQCHAWNNNSSTTQLATQQMETSKEGLWKVFAGCQRSKASDTKHNETSCQCMKHTKTARRRKLKSRSGFYLAIMPNGQIMGNRDPNNSYVDIDVIPVGADLVKIWGVESELFLMIDDAGQMRGTDVDSAECIFEETLTENFFTVYYSAMYLHKRWCVGIRNKTQTRSFYRKPKPAKDTSFVVELVQRRPSGSSLCDSDDSRVST